VFQASNSDIPVIHFVAVVLQDDVARAPLGEMRNAAVLARRERRVHGGSSEIELDDLAPVQPVLTVISAQDYPRAVPFTGRFEILVAPRRDEIV
jgi:hypothetical protein